jgi:hypothetical protein
VFCITFDRIAVSFPGARMDVSFESATMMGSFHCWQDRADVEEVMRGLQPRIGLVIGDRLDLFVASECGR